MNWRTYDYLYKSILEFQKENNIIDTCNPFEICRKNGWKLIRYSDHPMAVLTSISEDGFSKYKNNEFYIFYNDLKPFNRQKFTIAHEIGHIYLYHHFYVNSEILSSTDQYHYKKKPIWETQADLFAQNILITVNFAEKLKNQKDIHEISLMLNLSEQMVTVRFKKLFEDIKWLKRNKSPFLNAPCVKCPICGSILLEEHNYCKICGEKMSALNKVKLQLLKLTRKEVKLMEYSKIEVNTDSKAIKCPVCGNTDVVNGEYCQICGVNITNKCTNTTTDYNGNLLCGTLLPGNARYCPHCGSQSTFYQSRLLSEWDNDCEESECEGSNDGFVYNPDEIPF